MRKKGKIAHWNRKKGFGFIEPVDGGDNVFVHITALQKKEIPTVGTQVSFAIGEGKGGRECAVDVQQAGEQDESVEQKKSMPLGLWLIPVGVIFLVALFFGSKFFFGT